MSLHTTGDFFGTLLEASHVPTSHLYSWDPAPLLPADCCISPRSPDASLQKVCSHLARRSCSLSCPSGARDPVYSCAPGPSPGAIISPRNRGRVASAEG